MGSKKNVDLAREINSDYTDPFFFEGSKTGCLLIHGFTGAPGRVRLLGEYIHEKTGYTCSGIRLKGHGTTVDDMYNTDWHDWLDSAKKGYEELQKKCDRIYVIGFSMGGVLTLLLGEEYPVDKLITINAPLRMQNSLASLSRILKFFKRLNTWEDDTKYDKEVEEYNTAYEAVPIKTIPSLLTLIKMAEKKLEMIVRPTLIIQTQKDDSVNPISARIIYKGISSVVKEVFWLKKSKHVATLGPERDLIHTKVVEFLESEFWEHK